jgi:MarR family transcriptional regulator, transcriptional regulator for hemolysin
MPPRDIAVLQRVGWLFRELNVRFREEIEAALRRQRVGLSFSQVSTLSILSSNPGINGAQLARRNMVTPQAMTSVLRQLSAKGLLVRREHPESLRADSWHVTAKGEKALQRGRAAFAEVTERMLASLAHADIGRLEELLRSCASSLA